MLGSGSAGNSLVVSLGGDAVLLDAGFSVAQTDLRLRAVGVDPRQIRAILVTHEHGDHIGHAGRLSKAFKAPIYATQGTLDAGQRHLAQACAMEVMRRGECLRFGKLEVEAVSKPHDAADPLSFLVHADERTLGFFTDLGHVDATVAEAIGRCDFLLMEANHDTEMLATGPYPHYLRERVGGKWGHISNEASARALARCLTGRLRTLLLGHLSTKNNDPMRVVEAFRKHLGDAPGYPRYLSYQDRPLGPFDREGRLLRSHGAIAATSPSEGTGAKH